MPKTRLEAFSDGVIAIVITLLILDIRLPEVEGDRLVGALEDAIPKFGAYAMSFVVIGLYWISHHRAYDMVRRVDGVFLWMNTLLLMCISFIPFPTSLLGRYPFHSVPIIMYGCTLIATNFVGFMMLVYLHRHPALAISEYTDQYFRAQIPIYAFVNGSYLAGILLAGTHPGISYALFAIPVVGMVSIVVVRTRDIARPRAAQEP